jgi:hypothetical protein
MPRAEDHNEWHELNQVPNYPLRFDPIYQYRLWGGRRMADLLAAPLPADVPIGEAWILSDRDDYPSVVADGPLKGKTIGQLLKEMPQELLGKLAGRFSRFPVLLKFLDVSKTLSVQVHPSDADTELIPAGESGKTEAWVILEAGPESRIDAEMGSLLDGLLGIVKVSVISGGKWSQFEKQVLAHLTHDERLGNLSLLPTCGTKFYQYASGWSSLYSEDFTGEEKAKIISSMTQATGSPDFRPERTWGEIIEDRGSQITFSGLGQEAPTKRVIEAIIACLEEE